jgi:hypothetical protein
MLFVSFVFVLCTISPVLNSTIKHPFTGYANNTKMHECTPTLSIRKEKKHRFTTVRKVWRYQREIKSRRSKRTDNTIIKRNRTMIYKILHRKLKIEQHEPHWKPDVNSCCFTCGTRRVTQTKHIRGYRYSVTVNRLPNNTTTNVGATWMFAYQTIQLPLLREFE